MSTHSGAGSLDECYAGKGQAPIPGPDAPRLLRVINATAADDGSIRCCGHKHDTPDELVFARLDSQGHFDCDLGHVAIEPMDKPPTSTFGLYQFIELVHLGAAHDGDMLALSLPFEITEQNIYFSLAIGRYTSKLAAKPGFGDNGIQFVPHASAPSVRTPSVEAPIDSERLQKAYQQALTKAVSPLGLPRAALIGESIKVMYQASELGADGVETMTTHLASFEAESGKPLKSYQIVIDVPSSNSPDSIDTDKRSPMLFDVAFLPDGHVLLLCLVGDNTYLTRLAPDGIVDSTFGERGLILLPGTGYVGMATNERCIVVTQAPPWTQVGYASTVYQFTHQGKYDTDFNEGQPLKVSPYRNGTAPTETLRLYHAAFDDHGDIVLAGAQGRLSAGAIESRLCTVRLQASGRLDTGFGSGGYALGPDSMTDGEGLYVHQDGIRLLTRTKTGDGYIVKRRP